MALGMSLSGMFNTGHDIGGFFGPVPDAELLIRWTQDGVFSPRFIMNSWKADGSVNTPWLHPDAHGTRSALRSGCAIELMPYLYTLLWRAAVRRTAGAAAALFEFGDDARRWRTTTR